MSETMVELLDRVVDARDEIMGPSWVMRRDHEWRAGSGDVCPPECGWDHDERGRAVEIEEEA